MLRWHLLRRNSLFNVYLHHHLRSDADLVLHDHPYFNMSFILVDDYVEHTSLKGGVQRRVLRRAGEIIFRSPWLAHRIELHEGRSCWSLFITGPRIREWGFHCPSGWRDFRYYKKQGCD